MCLIWCKEKWASRNLPYSRLGLAPDVGVDLLRGYLFRATTPDLGIKDMCSHGNTMDVRLLFLV